MATCKFTEGNTPDLGAGFFDTISWTAETNTISAGLYAVQEGTESPPSRFANYTAIGPATTFLNVTI